MRGKDSSRTGGTNGGDCGVNTEPECPAQVPPRNFFNPRVPVQVLANQTPSSAIVALEFEPLRVVVSLKKDASCVESTSTLAV